MIIRWFEGAESRLASRGILQKALWPGATFIGRLLMQPPRWYYLSCCPTDSCAGLDCRCSGAAYLWKEHKWQPVKNDKGLHAARWLTLQYHACHVQTHDKHVTYCWTNDARGNQGWHWHWGCGSGWWRFVGIPSAWLAVLDRS